MPGFNPENINIHDLTVEEPEKQVETFDPEKEISEDDWKSINEWLASSPVSFGHEVVHARILKPEFEITDRNWSDTFKLLNEIKGKFIGVYEQLASQMRIIDPNLNAEQLGVDQAMHQSMQERLVGYRKQGEWRDFCKEAVVLKTLYPNEEIAISKEDLRGMHVLLERYRKDPSGDRSGFARYARNIKLLDSHVDLGLDEVAWQGMKKELERWRRLDKWHEFLRDAAAMKILAAQEVKVTDKGLEINMRKVIQEENAPELPEQRKF